jgi:anti-sigma regulatory factor (Ser/Thr protein kinase)
MIVATQCIEDGDGYTWALTASPKDIERWRAVAAETVAMLGGDQGAVALARLGVSELLSNVVKHVSDPQCLLVIGREGDRFRVTVHDRSTEAPAVTVPGWDAESGRGLWLLREMVRDWGYSYVSGGKAVWFRSPLVSMSEVAA